MIYTKLEVLFDNRFEATIDRQLKASKDGPEFPDYRESFAISTATPINKKIHVVQPDEYEVYIDEDGNAQALDWRIINVSKDDIEAILEMADKSGG